MRFAPLVHYAELSVAVAFGLALANTDSAGSLVVRNEGQNSLLTCSRSGAQELDNVHWDPVESYSYQNTSSVVPGPWVIDRDIIRMVGKLSIEEKVGQMSQIQVGQVIGCDGKLNESMVEHWINKWKVGSFLETPGNHDGEFSWYSPENFADVTDTVQRIALKTGPKLPIIWGLDSVRGANYVKGGTIFPSGTSTAATFNQQLAYEAGRIAAKDTRAAGVHWSFAPVLDLSVNKLWSRTYENFGEDPYLSSQMSSASVKGFQGDYKHDRSRVAACLKHFIGYGYPFDGSDRANRHIATHELLEYYVPPFQAAIDAGSATAMESYGVVNGEAVMLSHYYLTQLLRKQMGFAGLLVTDWAEINSQADIYATARNRTHATQIALQRTSVDMSMVADDESFMQATVDLVKNGAISEARLDESVARILQLKKDLGLFDSPFADKALAETVGSLQDVEAARDTARESITLLKNDKGVLPLSKSDRVLFIGPTLNSTRYMGGGWNVHWTGPSDEEGDAVYQGFGDTVIKGVEQVTGAAPKYMKAVDINGTGFVDIDKVIAAAKDADKIVIGLGENSYAENSGNIDGLLLPQKQLDLVSILASKAKKPIAVVLIEGRPRRLGNVPKLADAILDAYLPGAYGGLPIAEILYGKVNPSGRLPITYPATEAQASSTIWQSSYVDYRPQWPFGFGLGYSKLKYSNVTLSSNTLKMGSPITAKLTVTNHGPYPQKEPVQLYTHQHYRVGYAPDLYRLRAFEKVDLGVGESKTISLKLSAEELAFWDRNLRKRVEPAPVTVAINPFTQMDIHAVVELEADPEYVLDEADY
ncbi:hypothetical protein H4R20_003019 [Coemansia guatemalensis]|uniref:beta-glucosidase n=1 Tax=Coemansia guatemalensis TaxID=2761395 RepID=A0A9W8I1E2_9FUNG|nr:hypothetical protein H4R20_003019 [Coemansia guatemalensis]